MKFNNIYIIFNLLLLTACTNTFPSSSLDNEDSISISDNNKIESSFINSISKDSESSNDKISTDSQENSSVHEHIFSTNFFSDECGHWYECNSCHEVKDYNYHQESDWIIDLEPTISTDGIRHKECLDCKYVIVKETIDAIDETKYNNIILDYKYSYDVSGKYSTGNYGISTISKIDYEYYRSGICDNDDFITLLPGYDSSFLGGSFANYDPIKGIYAITLNYTSNLNAKLYFGNTKLYENEFDIPASVDSYLEYTFYLNKSNINYFMIETGNSILNINNISIKYSNNSSLDDFDFISCGEGLFRINPNTYNDTLISGVSKISMPIEVSYENDAYKIIKSKTYTYYSYESIMQDNSLAKDATYTNPIDVANYFIAFKTWPCNYYPYTKNIKDLAGNFDLYTAQDIFQKDFRYVSYYTRTDGYVNYVPYAKGENGLPNYYELDIDLDGSYYNEDGSYTRGVGRLVLFADGFKEKGYDNSPVAIYTDDHYDTFQEYYNNGLFSYRFNAAYSYTPSNRCKYKYGITNTIN